MAINTYETLVSALESLLLRDDLAADIPDFIALAESRFRREIRIREMIQRQQLVVNDRFVALPVMFLEAMTFRLLTNPVTVLTEVSLAEMSKRRREISAKPAFFAIHNEIELDVMPNESLTGELIYYKEFTPLAPGVAANALLLAAPDIYLYGSAIASAPKLHFDERLQTWATLYTAARDALTQMDRRARHVGPLVSRVAGATP